LSTIIRVPTEMRIGQDTGHPIKEVLWALIYLGEVA